MSFLLTSADATSSAADVEWGEVGKFHYGVGSIDGQHLRSLWVGVSAMSPTLVAISVRRLEFPRLNPVGHSVRRLDRCNQRTGTPSHHLVDDKTGLAVVGETYV